MASGMSRSATDWVFDCRAVALVFVFVSLTTDSDAFVSSFGASFRLGATVVGVVVVVVVVVVVSAERLSLVCVTLLLGTAEAGAATTGARFAAADAEAAEAEYCG